MFCGWIRQARSAGDSACQDPAKPKGTSRRACTCLHCSDSSNLVIIWLHPPPLLLFSYSTSLGVTMKLALVAAFVTTSSILVTAQDTSKCPDETYQSIIRCSDQVYADEGKAPCSSSDWECICQIQQGLLSCYDPCPEAQDADAIRFNNENCAGQHGVKNKAAAGPWCTPSLQSPQPGRAAVAPRLLHQIREPLTPTSGTTSATNSPSSTSTSTSATSDASSPTTSTEPNGALPVSPLSLPYLVPAILLGGTLFGAVIA
ncbi:hypothetical protein C8Q74DRAFT_387060 [Fomes fomentarius]|nr:hypothetical protein C8Q74DRAFT_387060 [Fomes fomentarius]